MAATQQLGNIPVNRLTPTNRNKTPQKPNSNYFKSSNVSPYVTEYWANEGTSPNQLQQMLFAFRMAPQITQLGTTTLQIKSAIRDIMWALEDNNPQEAAARKMLIDTFLGIGIDGNTESGRFAIKSLLNNIAAALIDDSKATAKTPHDPVKKNNPQTRDSHLTKKTNTNRTKTATISDDEADDESNRYSFNPNQQERFNNHRNSFSSPGLDTPPTQPLTSNRNTPRKKSASPKDATNSNAAAQAMEQLKTKNQILDTRVTQLNQELEQLRQEMNNRNIPPVPVLETSINAPTSDATSKELQQVREQLQSARNEFDGLKKQFDAFKGEVDNNKQQQYALAQELENNFISNKSQRKSGEYVNEDDDEFQDIQTEHKVEHTIDDDNTSIINEPNNNDNNSSPQVVPTTTPLNNSQTGSYSSSFLRAAGTYVTGPVINGAGSIISGTFSLVDTATKSLVGATATAVGGLSHLTSSAAKRGWGLAGSLLANNTENNVGENSETDNTRKIFIDEPSTNDKNLIQNSETNNLNNLDKETESLLNEFNEFDDEILLSDDEENNEKQINEKEELITIVPEETENQDSQWTMQSTQSTTFTTNKNVSDSSINGNNASDGTPFDIQDTVNQISNLLTQNNNPQEVIKLLNGTLGKVRYPYSISNNNGQKILSGLREFISNKDNSRQEIFVIHNLLHSLLENASNTDEIKPCRLALQNTLLLMDVESVNTVNTEQQKELWLWGNSYKKDEIETTLSSCKKAPVVFSVSDGNKTHQGKKLQSENIITISGICQHFNRGGPIKFNNNEAATQQATFITETVANEFMDIARCHNEIQQEDTSASCINETWGLAKTIGKCRTEDDSYANQFNKYQGWINATNEINATSPNNLKIQKVHNAYESTIDFLSENFGIQIEQGNNEPMQIINQLTGIVDHATLPEEIRKLLIELIYTAHAVFMITANTNFSNHNHIPASNIEGLSNLRLGNSQPVRGSDIMLALVKTLIENGKVLRTGQDKVIKTITGQDNGSKVINEDTGFGKSMLLKLVAEWLEKLGMKGFSVTTLDKRMATMKEDGSLEIPTSDRGHQLVFVDEFDLHFTEEENGVFINHRGKPINVIGSSATATSKLGTEVMGQKLTKELQVKQNKLKQAKEYQLQQEKEIQEKTKQLEYQRTLNAVTLTLNKKIGGTPRTVLKKKGEIASNWRLSEDDITKAGTRNELDHMKSLVTTLTRCKTHALNDTINSNNKKDITNIFDVAIEQLTVCMEKQIWKNRDDGARSEAFEFDQRKIKQFGEKRSSLEDSNSQVQKRITDFGTPKEIIRHPIKSEVTLTQHYLEVAAKILDSSQNTKNKLIILPINYAELQASENVSNLIREGQTLVLVIKHNEKVLVEKNNEGNKVKYTPLNEKELNDLQGRVNFVYLDGMGVGGDGGRHTEGGDNEVHTVVGKDTPPTGYKMRQEGGRNRDIRTKEPAILHVITQDEQQISLAQEQFENLVNLQINYATHNEDKKRAVGHLANELLEKFTKLLVQEHTPEAQTKTDKTLDRLNSLIQSQKINSKNHPDNDSNTLYIQMTIWLQKQLVENNDPEALDLQTLFTHFCNIFLTNKDAGHEIQQFISASSETPPLDIDTKLIRQVTTLDTIFGAYKEVLIRNTNAKRSIEEQISAILSTPIRIEVNQPINMELNEKLPPQEEVNNIQNNQSDDDIPRPQPTLIAENIQKASESGWGWNARTMIGSTVAAAGIMVTTAYFVGLTPTLVTELGGFVVEQGVSLLANAV